MTNLRTFKHSALIDLDLASFSDGEVGHCGYSGNYGHDYGHFMRSFGVIKLKPTGKPIVQMLIIPRPGGIKFEDIETHHQDSEKGSDRGQSQGQIRKVNKNQETGVPWQLLPDDMSIGIRQNGRK